MRLAACEGGGTSFVCAVAEGSTERIVSRASFPTTTPEETISKCRAWLQAEQKRLGKFDAIGIATFGPIDMTVGSATYGHITATPKRAWVDTDVVGMILQGSLKDLPHLFDTDVNAPALAEYRSLSSSSSSGECDEVSSVAYVTVGTGVGVGLVLNGSPVHGLLHPEAGHASVPRMEGDEYPGSHKSLNCVNWCEIESMCASNALTERAGLKDSSGLKDLDDSHEVWDAAAHYLAAMCANLVLTVSPQRIVLSGGIMLRASLFPKIRKNMVKMLNGYIPVAAVTTLKGAENFIVPSKWANDAGIIGALTLAQDALAKKAPKSKSTNSHALTAAYEPTLAILAAASVSFFLASLMHKMIR